MQILVNNVLFSAVAQGYQYALSTGQWVVLLCPTAPLMAEARQILAAASPVGSKFSGRTVEFPNGGRVSVCLPGTEPFVESRPFLLKLVCWAKNQLPGADRWWVKALEVLP